MVANTFDEPVRIAVIGGTGVQDLPGFELAASLTIDTPWGTPSAPISILRHTPSSSSSSSSTSGDSAKSVPIAFLARHGAHHQFAPHEIPTRANIAALRHLGVRTIIAFSAVGSLRAEIAPRDFVLPHQIIDRTKGVRPFTFFERGIVGHVGFADPFDPALARVIGSVGPAALQGDGVRLHERGLLVCMEGPQFSTRAESELYRSWDGAVINMSALPEAKLARECEMAYQMVCMSTDYDCWHAAEADVSVAMVMENMAANAQNAKRLVAAVLDELAKGEHEQLVLAKHLEGVAVGGITTHREAFLPEVLERMEFLFPGQFKKA